MPALDILEQISRIRTRAQLFIIDELARRGIEDVVPSHGAVLAHLYHNRGPVPVTALVVALKRPKSTITKTTDSLESGGYLSKRSNPGDGRSYLVDLTPRGRECYGVFTEISERLEDRLLKGLSQEDRQTFSRLLCALEENLE
ncbi:MAG: MarR family transcriptional regulator [Desulfovibrionaceae bacterium]|nr:MarR family transcriptional regulator [Desulfovibrionaceae bacterium]